MAHRLNGPLIKVKTLIRGPDTWELRFIRFLKQGCLSNHCLIVLFASNNALLNEKAQQRGAMSTLKHGYTAMFRNGLERGILHWKILDIIDTKRNRWPLSFQIAIKLFFGQNGLLEKH